MAACNTMAAEAAAEVVYQKLEMLRSHPVCERCSSMETLTKEAKEKLATIREFFSTQDGLSMRKVLWVGQLLQAMFDAEEFIDKFHLREARGWHGALHMPTRPPAALISKYKLRRDLSNLVNKMRELCQDQCLTGKMEAEGETRNAWQDEKLARLTSLGDWPESLKSFWRENRKKIKWGIGERDRKRSEEGEIEMEISEEILIEISEEGEIEMEISEEREIEISEEGEISGNLGWTVIKGEPGTGKTSLARWVYREARYLGFKWRAWVHLSASMNLEFLFEVLKQIRNLARELKDMNLEEMTVIHPHDFVKWKKFLIVLDGVHPSNLSLLGLLGRVW